MNRFWTVVLCCTMLLAAPAALAQEGDAPQRPWTDTAEFGLVFTTGNSETENFSFGNKFTYAWDNAELVIDALALRASSTRRSVSNQQGQLVVDEADETTAETYALAGKYRRQINDKLFWYLGAGWDRDVFSGIDSRYTAGGGLGYRFFKTDQHSLIGEFGVDYTDETRIDDSSDSFAGARGFLGYARNLSETSSWISELEVRQNLDETDDRRAVWVNALTASLSQKMALKVSYTIKYDNQPVTRLLTTTEIDPGTGLPYDPVLFEFDDVDTILSASLVVNF